jgi:hypothetical protein
MHMKKEYAPYEGMSEEDIASCVFATEPGMGACGDFLVLVLRILGCADVPWTVFKFID